jgi:hypothetical protein
MVCDIVRLALRTVRKFREPSIPRHNIARSIVAPSSPKSKCKATQNQTVSNTGFSNTPLADKSSPSHHQVGQTRRSKRNSAPATVDNTIPSSQSSKGAGRKRSSTLPKLELGVAGCKRSPELHGIEDQSLSSSGLSGLICRKTNCSHSKTPHYHETGSDRLVIVRRPVAEFHTSSKISAYNERPSNKTKTARKSHLPEILPIEEGPIVPAKNFDADQVSSTESPAYLSSLRNNLESVTTSNQQSVEAGDLYGSWRVKRFKSPLGPEQTQNRWSTYNKNALPYIECESKLLEPRFEIAGNQIFQNDAHSIYEAASFERYEAGDGAQTKYLVCPVCELDGRNILEFNGCPLCGLSTQTIVNNNAGDLRARAQVFELSAQAERNHKFCTSLDTINVHFSSPAKGMAKEFLRHIKTKSLTQFPAGFDNNRSGKESQVNQHRGSLSSDSSIDSLYGLPSPRLITRTRPAGSLVSTPGPTTPNVVDHFREAWVHDGKMRQLIPRLVSIKPPRAELKAKVKESSPELNSQFSPWTPTPTEFEGVSAFENAFDTGFGSSDSRLSGPFKGSIPSPGLSLAQSTPISQVEDPTVEPNNSPVSLTASSLTARLNSPINQPSFAHIALKGSSPSTQLLNPFNDPETMPTFLVGSSAEPIQISSSFNPCYSRHNAVFENNSDMSKFFAGGQVENVCMSAMQEGYMKNSTYVVQDVSPKSSMREAPSPLFINPFVETTLDSIVMGTKVRVDSQGLVALRTSAEFLVGRGNDLYSIEPKMQVPSTEYPYQQVRNVLSNAKLRPKLSPEVGKMPSLQERRGAGKLSDLSLNF